MGEQAVTIGLAALVVLGVTAQWIGRQLGFASLLLLLPAGMLAGSTGLVEPDQLLGELLFPATTLLVAVLLFQSGLKLRLDTLPQGAGSPIRRLVTVGAAITFAGATAGAATIMDVDHGLAFLLGAVLIVSGPTVVTPLLEVVRARPPTGDILRQEGVVLDPVGAALGVVVLNAVLAGGREGLHPVLQMLSRVAVGTAVGAVAAVLLVAVLSRFLVTDNMEVPVAIALAVAAHTTAELLLSEAGLIAALVMGVAVVNQRLVPTGQITSFGEPLEVLIIGVLFVMLGALVAPADVAAIAGRAAIYVAALVLVVRPVAVAVALAGTRLPWRDRALIGWVNPRGIVAAATAAQFSGSLTAAGVSADAVAPVTFAVILGTGVVYSLTAPAVARALDVVEPPRIGVAVAGHAGWVRQLAQALGELGVSVLLITSRPVPDDALAPDVRQVPLHESETALDRVLDEAAIGQALVLSAYNAVGTLIVADLVASLGRRHVYRLRMDDAPTLERLRVRRWNPEPFATGVTLADIEARTAAGETIQIVRGALPAGALLLATVREDGTVDLAPAKASTAFRTRATAVRAGVALVPAVEHSTAGPGS